jgi:hypothetical protein
LKFGLQPITTHHLLYNNNNNNNNKTENRVEIKQNGGDGLGDGWVMGDGLK